jgi:hypothetical protein
MVERVVGYFTMKHTNRGKRMTLRGCLYIISDMGINSLIIVSSWFTGMKSFILPDPIVA